MGLSQQNTDGEQRRLANLTNAGKGRPKGTPNKMTVQVKEMILAALDKAGGVDYLVKQASLHPGPFLSLVGKILPMQVTGEDGAAVEVAVTVRRTIEDPKAPE